jgi:hypothetical protein
VTAWSPEQIANRLKVEFPDDESMRISHEAIHVQSRGALKRELVTCLRTGRATDRRLGTRHQRGPHQRAPGRSRGSRRSRPLGRRPDHRVATLGDRDAGRADDPLHDAGPPASRGGLRPHPADQERPGAGGLRRHHDEERARRHDDDDAEQLRRSLTWDRGKELSAHAAFKVETGIAVFFADPQSPWQRGTNEKTNGLLRRYFPKGTDLARWSREEVEAVAVALNNRPRKTLAWKTLQRHLTSSYGFSKQPVVRRSIEPGQLRSHARGLPWPVSSSTSCPSSRSSIRRERQSFVRAARRRPERVHGQGRSLRGQRRYGVLSACRRRTS